MASKCHPSDVQTRAHATQIAIRMKRIRNGYCTCQVRTSIPQPTNNIHPSSASLTDNSWLRCEDGDCMKMSNIKSLKSVFVHSRLLISLITMKFLIQLFSLFSVAVAFTANQGSMRLGSALFEKKTGTVKW